MNNLNPLGQETIYPSEYSPSLLFSIQREGNRKKLGILSELPFQGADIWNAYELSWLNFKGKPQVAMAEFRFPCDSPNLVESKSFKLYLNSLNNTRFDSDKHVSHVIQKDLSNATESDVGVKLFRLDETPEQISLSKLSGACLDDLDIECHDYLPRPDLLKNEGTPGIVEESVYTHLLKSNCPVTGQPDWATLQIRYEGQKIHHESLLQYIVSLRNHSEFHEQCVERIYMNITEICRPKKLLVYARYTRRGGLDINPFRYSRNGGLNISPLRSNYDIGEIDIRRNIRQ